MVQGVYIWFRKKKNHLNATVNQQVVTYFLVQPTVCGARLQPQENSRRQSYFGSD